MVNGKQDDIASPKTAVATARTALRQSEENGSLRFGDKPHPTTVARHDEVLDLTHGCELVERAGLRVERDDAVGTVQHDRAEADGHPPAVDERGRPARRTF